MSTDQTWVSVRIDRQLLDALKAAAKEESRSVSKQILHYVIKCLPEKIPGEPQSSTRGTT